jgi:hypothetical protein
MMRREQVLRLFGATAYGEILAEVEQAIADPEVRAVLLRVNSPGGDSENAFETAAALAGLDGQLRQILGGKQSGLSIGFELGLDIFAELAEPLQLILVVGDSDMAHHPLAGLSVVAETLDELDGLARAVGSGLDANEHGRLSLNRAKSGIKEGSAMVK